MMNVALLVWFMEFDCVMSVSIFVIFSLNLSFLSTVKNQGSALRWVPLFSLPTNSWCKSIRILIIFAVNMEFVQNL
jgi:hypothetical protein